MVTIVGVLLGLVLLYFWLRGHWFAAVVATLVGLMIGTFIGEAPSPGHKHAPEVSFLFTAIGGALAWVPWLIRRQLTRPHPPTPQPIQGITLASRDASFNG